MAFFFSKGPTWYQKTDQVEKPILLKKPYILLPSVTYKCRVGTVKDFLKPYKKWTKFRYFSEYNVISNSYVTMYKVNTTLAVMQD